MVWQALAGLALVGSIAMFAWRLRLFNQLRRPVDLAPVKGRVSTGVLYAFTLGMAPWSKESTRLHAVAYLRGVAFHACIFLGLAILVFSPWLGGLPTAWRTTLAVVCAAGVLLGLAGLALRLWEPNLRQLSAPDDLFAPALVSLWLAVEGLWLAGLAAPAIFYSLSALMLLYAPLGKIRHCIFYAYSRLFYGRFIGRRGVVPHTQPEVG